MKRRAGAIVWLMFVALVVARAGGIPGETAGPTTVDHATFDRLLKKHVKSELVDYVALAGERGALDGYLDQLAAVDPAALTRDERLAFYINLYNASMLATVIERYRPGYSVAERSFAVFDEPRVRLGDRRISLNALEHEIIRPRFADPRIHAALVCAARSCPPLLPRAYRGDDLDAVLEANMRRFILDPKRNRIDGNPLRLSRIFDWYAEDFGGPASVTAYLARFAPGVSTDAEVEFLDYSWALNIAEPAEEP